jgi:hypothetical protein
MTITLTREEAQQVLDDLEALTAYIQGIDNGIVLKIQSIETLRARLSAPEPEPVAWMNEGDMGKTDWKVWAHGKPTATIPLYTAPPQREWQGLTATEMMELLPKNNDVLEKRIAEFACAIEAKLKEKNNERST